MAKDLGEIITMIFRLDDGNPSQLIVFDTNDEPIAYLVTRRAALRWLRRHGRSKHRAASILESTPRYYWSDRGDPVFEGFDFPGYGPTDEEFSEALARATSRSPPPTREH